MRPGQFDIEIYRGDRYELFFLIREETYNDFTGEYEPGSYIDLTGYFVRGQIRSTRNSDTVIANFICTLGDQIIDPGSVLCAIPSSTTSIIEEGKYVYDIELEPPEGPEYIETYLTGNVVVTGDVTRD